MGGMSRGMHMWPGPPEHLESQYRIYWENQFPVSIRVPLTRVKIVLCFLEGGHLNDYEHNLPSIPPCSSVSRAAEHLVGRSVGLSVYLSSHDLSYCNEYIQIPRTLGGYDRCGCCIWPHLSLWQLINKLSKPVRGLRSNQLISVLPTSSRSFADFLSLLMSFQLHQIAVTRYRALHETNNNL